LKIARTFNNKPKIHSIQLKHKKIDNKKEFKEPSKTMLAKKPTQLKMNRGIILFQIYSGKPTPVCISVSQTASLKDFHQKVDSILFPNKYSSFDENKPEKSFYGFSSKKKTNIHTIFARIESSGKILIIPNSEKINIVDFMDSKDGFFDDYSQLPQLHNLYRIYVIDNDDYEKYKEPSTTENFLKTVGKLTKCFG
jgi:hypothetical protein